MVSRAWWRADKGEVHERVLPYVRTVENTQAELYDKFVKLEAAYDTNPRTNRYASQQDVRARTRNRGEIIFENLVAGQIDTVAANVADTDVRTRIKTDGADWSHQRTAKRLELYADGLGTLLEVGEKCRSGFKLGGALKGTGLNKVWIDQFEQIQVTPCRVDNIVVDELECPDGRPKQLHYRDFFDREDLAAQFPDFEDKIERAQTMSSTGNWRLWAGYRPLQGHEIVVLESWRLPIGPRGHKNYVPGRHTLVIDGCDFLDEEYHKPHYPFAVMRWNKPAWGFYGISLAERIMPHQNLLNRRNFQINKSLNLKANPTTYVHQGDQNLAVKTTNELGTIAVYKVAIPTTVDYQAVGKETYDSRLQIKADAASETGVNQAMSGGAVPSGIESGVGVREVRSTRTQRFSIQERAFERFWLDTLWLVLDCCRDLGGTKAPEILKVSKYGNKRIKWSDVDLDDLKIEMMAASTMGDTEAGRQQRVTELAQAGLVTSEEARELYDHPDIGAVMSMYNAAYEDIQATVEAILDGATDLMPEPYQNLKLGVYMLQNTYLRAKDNGAPEEVLEALAAWIATAANILNPVPTPTETPMGGMPVTGAPAGPDTGVGPPPMPPDMGPPPQSALATGAYRPMGA